ncbi:MAG: hypothetical protein COV47_05050 [Candidatus Diapherotrites archaeon CG11_big_fil_rev_8_21_14_0_20_37_9]|nr:MAG: hypothetical protein COV47_05050 [Candidatus Diapherotrites archaeon CG11_big_fil_rev_8_21_14_0_20_37_9]
MKNKELSIAIFAIGTIIILVIAGYLMMTIFDASANGETSHGGETMQDSRAMENTSGHTSDAMETDIMPIDVAGQEVQVHA